MKHSNASAVVPISSSLPPKHQPFPRYSDNALVGTADGTVVGIAVGDAVGPVGTIVGARVGTRLGTNVGTNVGV